VRRRATNYTGEISLATCDEPVVVQFCFGVQHIPNGHAQAALARGAAHPDQITSLPVQQRQSGRTQHPKMESEKTAVWTAQVLSTDQLPERFDQSVISDEPGPLRFLANPAEEEALAHVMWSVRHEPFGERKQSFNEPWDGCGRRTAELSLLFRKLSTRVRPVGWIVRVPPVPPQVY
jgi:hypothetical protein